MGYQENVREVYLDVIESTIAGAKEEFAEAGPLSDALTATLDRLRERWEARLLESQDFTDDPTGTATSRGAQSRGGSAAGKKAATNASSAGSGAAGRGRGAGSAGERVPSLAPSQKPAKDPKYPISASPGSFAERPATSSSGRQAIGGTEVSGGPGAQDGTNLSVPAPHQLRPTPQPSSQTGGGSVGVVNIGGQGNSVHPNLLAPLVPPAPGMPAPGSGQAPVVGPSGAAPFVQHPKVEGSFPGGGGGAFPVAGSLQPLLGETPPSSTGGGGPGITPGDIPQGDAPGSSDGSPPAKRARRENDGNGDEVVNSNENLDSSDSDDDGDVDGDGGSDTAADNYILAQHDSVKKGGGNGKWKVRLKDGILHVNGRDYLFSRANCDLDW